MGFVDLHSHVLPALDDGARTLDESMEMLRLLRLMGWETVCATPHQRAGLFLPSRESIDDAHARVHLSSLLIKERRYGEALPHLREAARLKPGDPDIVANLGTVLALRGDLEGAIAAYQQALRIDPNHKTARANLDHARAQLEKK